METIRHRVGIDAPIRQVARALDTIEGLRTWWTTDTTGDTAVGGKVVFTFGGPKRSVTMEVLGSAADGVVWRVVEGPDEWIDTTLAFELAEVDGETAVLFSHGGWREAVPFMHHCSTKWGYFLLSLKAAVERGEGTPFPDDMDISSWG
jgi:uncharacterized protein YndB with AHSA1/START domain